MTYWEWMTDRHWDQYSLTRLPWIPPCQDKWKEDRFTRSIWPPTGGTECLERCVLERLIWVLDCMELCVPTVWNSREGFSRRNDMWRNCVTILKKRLGVKSSLNLWGFWSVCHLSSPLWICRLDLWLLGYVPRQHLLTDEIREPYFLWGLSV